MNLLQIQFSAEEGVTGLISVSRTMGTANDRLRGLAWDWPSIRIFVYMCIHIRMYIFYLEESLYKTLL